MGRRADDASKIAVFAPQKAFTCSMSMNTKINSILFHQQKFKTRRRDHYNAQSWSMKSLTLNSITPICFLSSFNTTSNPRNHQTTPTQTKSRRSKLEISREKEASLWLTTLPIKNEEFLIDKQLFWDLIKIRYGYQLTHLLNQYSCGSKFDLDHPMSCKKGSL